MKLDRRIVVGAVSVILVAVCSLAILRTPPPPPPKVPDWVKHYETAEKAWLENNVEEWDRQAKLVLKDSDQYSGKMPPQAPMSAEQAQIESALWFFPMQDRGETMKYTEALANLAINYRHYKKWDDAVAFHRRIFDLEQAEWRAHPKTARMPDPSMLVTILHESGKKKEAIELQKDVIANAEFAAAQKPGYTELQTVVLMQRAKYFELQEKISEAEGCWMQFVDMYKSELTDENLAKVKRANANANLREGYTENLFSFRPLEGLAEFYARHKNAAGEERALLKILSLRQAIVPDNYPGLYRDWGNLSTFYEKHRKYDEAAKTILQRMKCQEKANCWERLANAYLKQGKFDEASSAILKSIDLHQTGDENRDKGHIASLYFWNSTVLQKAGKQQESKLAKEKALSIDPECTGYYRVWN
jgi:tetratricopeptide (TPR) repeat protein